MKETQEGADGHHCGPPKEYIITQTLAEHLDAFAYLDPKLKIPDTGFIKEIEDGLVEQFKHLFENAGVGVTITEIPIHEQGHQIISAVNRIKKTLHQPVVVSTCPLLANRVSGSKALHLSRLIDIEGNIIGIGPRPYHDLPARQVAGFANEIADRDVILVEDGSFTGSTVLFTLGLLKEKRARVRAIVLGVMFPGAEKKIREVFDGEIVSCKKPQDPLDWMPSHDFFPFIPNAGRVVGHRLGKVVMPVYLNYSNAAMAVPYIRPYGKTEWASLPGDQHALTRFSSFCLHSAKEIFMQMEAKNNGDKISVGDIIGSDPATYVPVSCGGHVEGFSCAGDHVTRLIELDQESFN